MEKHKKKFSFGPGFVVTAAFIGPGTITTCSMAGSRFGYSLIFALVFATLTTIILQEMAGRLSLISNHDLAQALREFPQNRLIRFTFKILTLSSITLGCAAYETGNIIGGALGLEMISPISAKSWTILIALVAIVILSRNKYVLVEKFLVALVFLMSLSFFLTVIIIKPSLLSIFKGFIPSFPKNSLYIILALVGTTVVPYNLFLHSSAVKEKWGNKTHLKDVKKDLLFSITLGGIISASIVITSAVSFHEKGIMIEKGSSMAEQLSPLFGPLTNFLFGLGFFSAGMSSAITAPYAASFASSGILGWKEGSNSKSFKLVWMAVILIGVLVSLSGFNPLEVIVFAQVANGIVLPVASIFLLIVLNNRFKMGNFANTPFQNILGAIVVLLVICLGLWNIIKLF